MSKTPISVSWSGGKDSAYMLHLLLQDERYTIAELHTAVSAEHDRVSMHGVPRALMQAQADAIGLPIRFLAIPADQSNASYERVLHDYYEDLKAKDIKHIACGDIFLEDLKIYREQIFAENGMYGLYPLWKKETRSLVREIMDAGFKTVICTANKELFPTSICGQILDLALIDHLDPKIDPCGENGEFHSFVFDGPIFKRPVPYQVAEITEKSYELKRDEDIIKSTFEFADIRLA